MRLHAHGTETENDKIIFIQFNVEISLYNFILDKSIILVDYRNTCKNIPMIVSL
jgi:hypothetical protein